MRCSASPVNLSAILASDPKERDLAELCAIPIAGYRARPRAPFAASLRLLYNAKTILFVKDVRESLNWA
jgi:hypothetical protein